MRGESVGLNWRAKTGEAVSACLAKGPLRRVPDKALGALAVLAAGALVAAAIAWWPMAGEAQFEIEAASTLQEADARPAADALREQVEDAPRSSIVVVDVAGAVERPGVYELPAGSRVIAAVEAAGGATADAETAPVNLARVLVDGEQVYIPTADEALAPAAAVSAGKAGEAGRQQAASLIDINTATASELEALPGIGPSTAAKIVADREANGPFSSKEDLKRVSGIGEKKYAAIEDAITASQR